MFRPVRSHKPSGRIFKETRKITCARNEMTFVQIMTPFLILFHKVTKKKLVKRDHIPSILNLYCLFNITILA